MAPQAAYAWGPAETRIRVGRLHSGCMVDVKGTCLPFRHAACSQAQQSTQLCMAQAEDHRRLRQEVLAW